MYRIIPELKGQGKNTLYVIGNGFDIFHGLKTSYQYFYEWLKANNCGDFISDMEAMFPTLCGGKILLWKDFENAMNSYELLDIHRYFFQGTDDLYDDATCKMVVERIKPTLKYIPIFLRQWLKHIDVYDAKPRFELDRDSMYLSFNYTMLLEHIYLIPENRVIHIHNSIENDAPLITGHKTTISEYSAEDQCKGYIEEQSTKLIAQEMNLLVKPVNKLKEKYKEFFAALKEISNVVVFGHSLCDIDMPYILEIQKNVQDDAHWYFITKDEENVEKINKYVKQYNDYYNPASVLGAELFCKKMMRENCKYITTDE